MGKILKFYEGDQDTIVRTTAPALAVEGATGKILMAQYVGNDVYAMVIEEAKVKYAPFDPAEWPFISGVEAYLTVVPGTTQMGTATITDTEFKTIDNTVFEAGKVESATVAIAPAGIVYEGDTVVTTVTFTAAEGYTFDTPIVKINEQTFVGEVEDKTEEGKTTQTLAVVVPVTVTR